MATLIIGGGLSGLALARMLQQRGDDYLLVEARDRFGGRILTQCEGQGAFDMGPAWFWPGQPRIAALIEQLGLQKFDQYSDGILTYEDESGRVERGRGFASMQGSWRLRGGLGALTDRLADLIPVERKRSGAAVRMLARDGQGVVATLADGSTLKSDRVVLALPPRIAATLAYQPQLPDDVVATLRAIPTWMAGQAKAMAIYDRPFWRDAGLSGDVMSRHGPMVEMHDASPGRGGPYALFGFIGVPPVARTDQDALRHHLIAQLVRLFGEQAGRPRQLLLKDWAADPHTATSADLAPLYAHPTYGLPHVLHGMWQGRVLFSGTELAPQFGGYLEGALEAAQNTVKTLCDAE